MKRTLTAILLTAFVLSSSAQTWFVKAGGGLSSQWGASGPITAAKIGFGYEYEFNQTLTFAPSLSLATRGWQNPDVNTPDMLFDDNGNMLDANGHITTDLALQAQRPMVDGEGNPIPGRYMESRMHRSFTTNYLQLDLPFVYYHRIGESRYRGLDDNAPHIERKGLELFLSQIQHGLKVAVPVAYGIVERKHRKHGL